MHASKPTACALAVLSACLSLAASGVTRAEERAGTPASEKPGVDEIVVTATRLDQRLDEVSRSLAMVQRDEIDRIQPQSVAQALGYQANIAVVGGPRPQNQSVNIRGLSGSQVLQTIDGARQNFDSGHRPGYFLDPELLQSVEALRGPASSLWGSGAIGGVVAQRTIDPERLLRDGNSIGGFVKTGFNANNDQNTSTVALAGRGDDIGWLASGYHRDGDDVELGNGERLTGSATSSHGLMGKLDWRLDEQQNLSLVWRRAETEGTVPSNAGAEINDTSNFLIRRDQVTENGNLSYRLDTASPLVDFQALAYYNKVDFGEQRVRDGRSDRTELEVLGLNVSNVSEWDRLTLAYGIDTYREDFSSDRGGSNRPQPPRAETTVWSSYAKAIVPVSETWRLEMALRYDDFTTENANIGEERSDSATSPSAALVWEAADWATLTLRHDRAFRAPSAEELYTSGTHFCIFPGFCNRFEPNPELDPERAANTELHARFEFLDTGGADRIGVEASLFENRIDDFIEQIVVGPSFFPVMDPGTTNWVNVDEATLRGFEVTASYETGPLAARLAYGLTHGEDDATGADLTNVPADTLTGDLSYRFAAQRLLTGLRVVHAADQDRTDYPENTAGIVYDGYTVTDLYASWLPRLVDGLRLDLSVNNLGDKFYRRAWEQLPQTGREIILSARYSF